VVSNKKTILIVLISALLALAYGYFYSQFTLAANYLALLAALMMGVVYLALFLVKSLVIENRSWIIKSIIVDVLMISAFFWKTAPAAWLVLGLALTMLLFFVADWRGKQELDNMIKIRFRELKLTVISTAFLSLVFISLFLYISVLDFNQIKLSRAPFDYAVRSSESLVQKVLPTFSTKLNFGELLKMAISKARPDLPPENSDALITDLTDKIERSTNTVINLQENALDVIYNLINNFLNKIPQNLRLPVIIAFALVMFFIINGGAFIFIWLISLLAWLIYKLMLTTNFAHITLERSQKETVSLEE